MNVIFWIDRYLEKLYIRFRLTKFPFLSLSLSWSINGSQCMSQQLNEQHKSKVIEWKKNVSIFFGIIFVNKSDGKAVVSYLHWVETFDIYANYSSSFVFNFLILFFFDFIRFSVKHFAKCLSKSILIFLCTIYFSPQLFYFMSKKKNNISHVINYRYV